jgi:hypothetical protein
MIVYRIVNKLNGMTYIGTTTKTLKKRWGVPSPAKRGPLGRFIKSE